VDANGGVDAGTDVVYVARRLALLPPVPDRFRDLDGTIPSDAEIGARVDALGSMLDVDASGSVDVATDLVYITRHLLGLPPVPESFRVGEPTIPSDSDIITRIELLLP
jgi:hypothetical protein